jgi:hypothetical protein
MKILRLLVALSALSTLASRAAAATSASECYRFQVKGMDYDQIMQGPLDIEWNATTNQVISASWLECGGSWTNGVGGTCTTPVRNCIDEVWHSCLGAYGVGTVTYSAPGTFSVSIPVTTGNYSCDYPNFIFAHIVQNGPFVNNYTQASIGGVQLGNYGRSIAAEHGTLCKYTCGGPPCD